MSQQKSIFFIDTEYDVRLDANGKDPDLHSPTLRSYHKFLWSKQLPSGRVFELEGLAKGYYLRHSSDLGEFRVGSDSVMQTFSSWDSLRNLTSQLDRNEQAHFVYQASTIGATIIFPSNRIEGKTTINAARGFSRRIADRFDLTLECIRRHYQGGSSPLEVVLHRYETFFKLFVDFSGYVDFFLLQDLVTDRGDVLFFTDFHDFQVDGTPRSVAEYLTFRERSLSFIEARNSRIRDFCISKLESIANYVQSPY